MVKIKRALISVWDKKGLDEFVRGLHELGIEILSTGGTSRLIEAMGLPVRSISSYTGFPEMLDGRVKTLHPKIHGALLALRQNADHMRQLEEQNIELIDLVVVNLYPFQETVLRKDVKLEEAIESIDIGGPSMLRSAAKNFKSVAAICNPDRYGEILKELRENDCSLRDETLQALAVEVFRQTAHYDSLICSFLEEEFRVETAQLFPTTLKLRYEKVGDLRYGENPHQRAAFYRDAKTRQWSIARARQLHGKELSFNNILDLDAAAQIVREFDLPAASIIKHTNPCGVAVASSLAQAYRDGLDCDRLSAFGSIVGLNKELERDTAEQIASADFVEGVIAPGYEEEALEALKQKKNLRVLESPGLTSEGNNFDLDLRKVAGGLLVQERDTLNGKLDERLKIVTKKRPTDKELESLLFGWKVAKWVKSNAIVLSQGTKTVGIGAGQMSRVDSVIVAIRKSGERARGSTLASDAFFPKADSIEAAAKAGVKAIIQPGGSIRDEEVIKAADQAGISMVFTGVRHFRH